MALAQLFQNLREYQIEKKGIDFADAVIPRQFSKSDSRLNFVEEKQTLFQLWSVCFEQMLQFGYPEFASTKEKKCTPGKSYNCKSICLNKDKQCRFPFEGQAKNYADWMAMQGKKTPVTIEATPTSTTKKSKKVSPSKPPTDTSDSSGATPTKTTKKSKKVPDNKPAVSTPDSDEAQSKSKEERERNPLIRTNDSELNSTRNDLIKRFGQDTVTSAEKNVQKILDHPDTNAYIRVGSSDTLELILGERFRTAHELGKTTHDIPHLQDENYLDARARVEAKSCGVKASTPDSDRPIYAYLGGSDMDGASQRDIGDAYGSIAVKLKPSVKDRATFTGSDSFKSGIASEIVGGHTPPPPNAASLVSSTRHGYDKNNLPNYYPASYKSKNKERSQLTLAAKVKNIDELAGALSPTGNKYVEAQIYGHVTPNDIGEIHFNDSARSEPTSAIATFAKNNKVDLYVDGKKLTTKEIDDLTKISDAENNKVASSGTKSSSQAQATVSTSKETSLKHSDDSPTEQERAYYGKAMPNDLMEKAREWVKKIPNAPPPHAEELAAVNNYSHGDYTRMNSYLRGSMDLDGQFAPDEEELGYIKLSIKLANATLDALPKHEGTVFRGTRLENKDLEKYKVGQIVNEKAFVSTTVSRSVGKKFSATAHLDTTTVHYEIKSKNGVSIKNFSDYPEEEEVLFRSDTNFKVLSIKKNHDGSVKIHMEEV